MNVDFTQLAPRAPDENSMSTPSDLRATTHACARYAQRVLGRTVEETDLHRDLALRGRCARGIARLFERAHWHGSIEDGEIWIAGTRALLIKNACVVTLIVAPTSKGFPKQFLRRYAAVERAA